MSITADGKIATANRRVSSFGSAEDREHLLELRATADAVMCGARTVDLNKITMGPGPERFRRLRERRGLAAYNLRVIVSGSGSIDPAAELFRHRFSPIIALVSRRAGARALKRLRTVVDAVCICGDQTIDFSVALPWLRTHWGVKRLLCEGGGALNAALFTAQMVNELHLTICPFIFGGRDAPTFAHGVGFSTLADCARLRLLSHRYVGDEAFVVYRVLAHHDHKLAS